MCEKYFLPASVQHLMPRQVAKRWQISESTLERWRTLGKGPVYLRLPGRVVYRLEDIEAFERDVLRCSTAVFASPGAIE